MRGIIRGQTASTPQGKPQLFLTRIPRTHSPPSPLPSTYRDSEGHRASETPDEGIVDGEPAEIGVPIAFGVQAHG